MRNSSRLMLRNCPILSAASVALPLLAAFLVSADSAHGQSVEAISAGELQGEQDALNQTDRTAVECSRDARELVKGGGQCSVIGGWVPYPQRWLVGMNGDEPMWPFAVEDAIHRMDSVAWSPGETSMLRDTVQESSVMQVIPSQRFEGGQHLFENKGGGEGLQGDANPELWISGEREAKGAWLDHGSLREFRGDVLLDGISGSTGDGSSRVSVGGHSENQVRLEIESIHSNNNGLLGNVRCYIPEARRRTGYCPEDGGPYRLYLVYEDCKSTECRLHPKNRLVTVAHSGGTATAGAFDGQGFPVNPETDFETIDPFTGTIEKGTLRSYSERFTVRMNDDTRREPVESIILSTTDPQDAEYTVNDVIIYILDDEESFLHIPRFDDRVGECTGEISVPVALIRNSTDEVSVRVRTTSRVLNVTPATPNKDYVPVDTTLIFKLGETSHSVDIEIIADEIPAGDSGEAEKEAFAVVMSEPKNADFLAGLASTYAGVFIEDESCIPRLTVDNASAEENVGKMDFTVKLDTYVGNSLIVDYKTIDGTATAPQDYMSQAAGQITFTANSSGDFPEKTIQIDLIDDDVIENAETFQVEFSSSAVSMVLETATGTIIDDDLLDPTVSIEKEGDIVEGELATFKISAAPVPEFSLTVSLDVAQTGDFVKAEHLGSSKTIEFDPASADCDSAKAKCEKSYEVKTEDDDTDEKDGAVTVTVQTGTGYEVPQGTQSTATVAVQDNDDPAAPVISITAGSSITEGEDAEFTVTADPVPTADLVVNLAIEQQGDFVATTAVGAKSVTIGTSGSATYSITTIEDNEDEANGSITATVKMGTGYEVPQGSQSTATVVVQDNDTPAAPVISITAGSSITEGEDAEFTVTADPVPTADLVVNLAIEQQGDFIATAAVGDKSVTIGTSGSATYSITTIEDNEDEANGSITATVKMGTGYEVPQGSQSTATVVIQDNDESDPVISITAGSSITEGEDAEFTVMADPVPTADLAVNLAIEQQGDFASNSAIGDKTVTIGTSGSATYSITTIEDDEDEANGSITATLNTGTGYEVDSAPRDQATVGVSDNDTAGLIVPATLTIDEGNAAIYRVKLATQPTGTVTVVIASQGGADVTVNPTLLSFNLASWDAPQSVRVTANHDDDAVDNSADLIHTASGGGYGGLTGRVIVAVSDDDRPGLDITPTYITVVEEDEGTYEVALLTQPTGMVEISIRSDNDEVKVSPTILTFSTANWSDAQVVTVSAEADEDTEDDEAELTHTASGGGYSSVTGPTVVVSVTDNDSAADLVLSPQSLVIDEGGEESFTVRLLNEPEGDVGIRVTGYENTGLSVSPVSFTIRRGDWNVETAVTVEAGEDSDSVDETETLTVQATGGGYDGLSRDVTVRVRDNDTAEIVLNPIDLRVEEGDYEAYMVHLATRPTGTVMVEIESDHSEITPDSTILRFTPVSWSTPQTVTVHAEEDGDAEGENATITHTATGGSYGGETEDLQVTVVDDDEMGIKVDPESLVLREGASGTDVNVSLATLPTAEVTVVLDLSQGISDEVSVHPMSLTFTPATWDQSQTVEVEPKDDSDREDEQGTIELSASGGGYGGVSGSVPVTVVDDDEPLVLGVLEEEIAVQENGGNAGFRVGLNRVSDQSVTVQYTTRSGTADAGVDYVETSGILTFQEGEQEQQVWVPILDDTVDEDDEGFTLELSGESGARLGNAIGRATILDNDDAPVVSIAPATYVREGRVANVYVRLSNASSQSFTVSYRTQDLTASAGQDYQAEASGSVTVSPGGLDAVIEVTTLDDMEHEGREAFLVELDGGSRSVVTILDNDVMPGLSVEDVVVSEGGGRARLAVTLSGASAVRVGVAYGTHDGTATAGEDYTRSIGTLVFAPGETVRSIWVPVQQDEVQEEDETFTLRLSMPEHAQLLDAEGIVMITDDPLEVSIFDGTGAEDAEELVLPVRLNYASSRVVTVQFSVTGGTATSDVDYEATQGVVVFEPGSVEAQVRIPLKDDDIVEGDETVEVTLSDPQNAVLGQAKATGTITDDDSVPGVQVRAVAQTGHEVVFVVTAALGQAVTGRYRTIDGTAWAGIDYESAEGVLEFGPGETRKEVRVPLLSGQGSGGTFALMVEVDGEAIHEEVVVGERADRKRRALLGRSIAVHVVEAVTERMQGSLTSCMPRPYPGQRVRASHMLSGCGMQASGGRISVWGRGAYSRLSGAEAQGADVVTASLGADYALGNRWMLGMVVSRSEAREAAMEVTGWYPYVRYGGQEHHVWGLGGAAQGEETGLRLMAAGLTGTVVRMRGMRLGYEADGFWLGMGREIGVSRVRAGLEGSMVLEEVLEPYVEAALLYSAGDAETGVGMEAGGGLRMRLGVLQGEAKVRRLVLEAEEGYGEWGYSGMVRYGGMEGLGVQVRPTLGRTHVGSLWQPERPWEVYPSDGRMDMEVGYGSRMGRRSVLRPHVGLGLRKRGRDYRIGAGVQGRSGVGFSISGLAMEYMAPYSPVTYGVSASGYVRW